MTSLRKQRTIVQSLVQAMRLRRQASVLEDQLWDRMPAVGREFGSPDFERLMQEDYRLGRGVFDPSVRRAFGSTDVRLADFEGPDELPRQPRLPI